nr:MAG TPA: hypothetical protein [Caudoviricetes sp.]
MWRRYAPHLTYSTAPHSACACTSSCFLIR